MKSKTLSYIILFLTVLVGFSFAETVTVIDLPGVGKVTADPTKQTLTFLAYHPGVTPMEFSICWNELEWNSQKGWYEGSQKCIQSEVGGWALPEFQVPQRTIPMPHYKTFTVTVGRYDKLAMAVCRENDGKLGCVQLTQTATTETCQQAYPSSPLQVVNIEEIVTPTTVWVSEGNISIKPTIKVPAQDVGKQAILLMYIAQSNGQYQLISSSHPVGLSSLVTFDLISDCISTAHLSFPVSVYVGYQIGNTIKYSYYIINKH
jgi:hypothetical protein